MGTGTSSSLPHVDCLTAPPGRKPCHTCLSTLTPEGKKNIRRNTSAAVRLRGRDGQDVTIVIDVGKSFQAAAVEWFPKYGLRRIDAVLITHAHADAMNGLDDLRGWTLHGAIQPYVDLYVSMDTFKEVQRAFPYLVSKEFASGGGDVPEFKWHIIEDRMPFEIGDTGIRITPFSVQHGRIFSTPPQVEFVPSPFSLSPASTNPSTPNPPGTPVRKGETLNPAGPAKEVHPYFCLGFVIQDSLVYVSDVSNIPTDIWEHLQSSEGCNLAQKPPPVFVLDCLRIEPHTSHLSVAESIEVARKMKAERTYWVGFAHELAHDDLVAVGQVVEGKKPGVKELSILQKEVLNTLHEGDPVWIRPAYDGLRVFISESGVERDEGYPV